MRRLIILAIMLLVALVMAVPAFGHVHLGNPSDECSRGKVPLGVTNPGGNDPQGSPQAGDVPAIAKCQKNK